MFEDSLQGHAGLVTGGAYGIGRATAVMLAAAGAKVAVADVHAARCEETVAIIEQAGGEAIALSVDVSQEDQVEQMVSQTLDAFGRLDFAHNNAGIAPQTGSTADCSLADYETVLSVNLTGAFLCMKHEIAHMVGAGGGSIINTASVAGVMGVPSQPAYTASKHGLVGATRAAALEYASAGVRVNVVCPGIIVTGLTEQAIDDGLLTLKFLASMTPMKRVAYPDDVAKVVVFLAGDGAGFLTGVVLPVDGGATAGMG